MKRDMDLAREILFQMESSNNTHGWDEINIPNISKEIISYHIKLLYQARLIEADDVTDSSGFEWKAKSITWEGREFIDSARNQSNWEKAKQYILSRGGSITFEALKISLSILLKQQLGV